MQAIARWFRQQSSWIESQQASILSAATIIFVANVISTLTGLVKNRVISATYIRPEYGNLIESYWVAFRAPEFAYQLIIVGSLSAAFIPLFTQKLKHSQEKAMNFAAQTMYLLLALFTVASIVIFVFAPQFVDLLTSEGFHQTGQYALAVEMTRIMMAAQMMFGVSGFLSSMLQSAKRFVIPAFSPVFFNIGIIATTIVFAPILGLKAAAWGTVVGAFLHMIIQIPLLLKLDFRLPLQPKWNRRDLLEFFGLTAPRTLALGVDQVNLWVITFLSTATGGITLTMLTFAQQLMSIPIRFFGVPIGQAALPFLSAEHDDPQGFSATVFRSLRQIMFFAAPASALLLVLRVPLVRLAYGTREFPWLATLDTAQALGYLAISIAPQAMTHLLIRAFYARNQTLFPLITSLLSVVITWGLGWWLGVKMGFGSSGIAIALALSATTEMVVLLVGLLTRIYLHGVAKFLFSLLRIGTAAFLMALTLFVFQRLLDLYVFETSRTWQLLQLTFVVTALGGTVYIGFCWLLKIEEITILTRLFERLRHQLKKTIKSTPEFVESVSQTEY